MKDVTQTLCKTFETLAKKTTAPKQRKGNCVQNMPKQRLKGINKKRLKKRKKVGKYCLKDMEPQRVKQLNNMQKQSAKRHHTATFENTGKTRRENV